MNGVFLQRNLYLGDRFNGINFSVENIKVIPEPEFKPTMKYKLLSACVISKINSDRNAEYLMPDHSEYPEFFSKHIYEKLKVAASAAQNTLGFNNTSSECIILKTNNIFKPRLIAIRPYTKQEVKVKGAVYELSLTAPAEIHRTLFNTGIGEKNSMGFGWYVVLPS